MATVRMRKSGWWQAIIDRKGHPMKSKTFEAKVDAIKWARDIENKIDRDVFVDTSSAEAKILSDALDDYEKEVSVNKDGYAVEKVRIAKWKSDPLAKRTLASLKPKDFAKWLAVRLETGITPSTARKDLAIISHLFTVAEKRWGMAVVNPISKIEIPTEDNSRDRRLVGDEESRLFAAMKKSGCGEKRANPWILPLSQLAIETAARQSELLALKWSDIDIDKLSIRFQGKERADGKRRLKNKSKFRDVPISREAKTLLENLPKISEDKNTKLFPTTASAVKQSFARAIVRANITDLHFHDLRHEGTSRFASIFDLHKLMKITGHDDTRMLARYYHPKVEDLVAELWSKTDAAAEANAAHKRD